MADEKRTGLGEGLRAGIGILNAFKEAIEETLSEAIERGDLSPERAKSVMKDAAQQIQSSMEEARERWEPVSRREFERLRQEVVELRSRLSHFESARTGTSGGPASSSRIEID